MGKEMKYRLLKNTIRGPKGAIVELDGNTARQLRENGIVGDPETPVRGPEVKKVVEPKVRKKTRASKATKRHS